MSKPKTPIEWLSNKIAYSRSDEDLRSYGLALLMMVDNDQVQDVFQQEMAEDGFFDEDEDDDYEPEWAWLGDDKETWDQSLTYWTDQVRSRINR